MAAKRPKAGRNQTSGNPGTLNKKDVSRGGLGELHPKAEHKTQREKSSQHATSGVETAALIHDLQVRQAELEMQNEELRRAQKELEQSRARYSDLYDFAPVGYFAFDKNGLVVEANLTGCQMLGVERSFLVKKPFSLFVDKDSQSTFHDHRQAALTPGLSQMCEITLVRKNGEKFEARLDSVAAADDEGNPALCRTIVTDITERKRTQEALRLSEQKFHGLFTTMSEAVVLFELIRDRAGKTVDCRVLDANPAVEKMTGIAPSDAVGRTMRELFPDTDDFWFDTYGKVETTGEPVSFERRFDPLDRFYHTYVYRPAAGRIAILFMDITERKQAEEQLRSLAETVAAEKDRLAALLNSITDEIWFADAAGKFTLVNPAGAQEFTLDTAGATDVKKLAESLEVLRLDGNFRPVEEAPPLRALRGEVVRNQEEIIRTPASGELRHRQVSSSPVRDASGSIIGSVSVVRDITDLKRAEEAVSRSKKTFLELVERAPFGIYTVDSQFRIAQMNVGSQNGAFKNVRPVIGRDFAEAMRILWPEPVAAEIIAVFRHTLDTGAPYYSPRFINPRHDVATVESYEWELHRIMFPDGQYGVICYYYDSTKLREAEASLREANDRYELVLAGAQAGIWDWDVPHHKVVFSPRWKAMRGFAEHEITDAEEEWSRTIHPDDAPRVMAAVQAHSEGKTAFFAEEYRVRRKDGSWMWIADRGVARRDADGRVVRMAGSETDITARKQSEEAMEWDVRRDELLSKTAARLLESEDPQGLVEDLCRRVCDFLDCQVFFNFLVDEGAGRLHLNACAGIPEEEARKIEWLDYDGAVCGCVARDRQRIIAEDIQNTADPRTHLVKPYGIQAYCCHPLIVQGRLIGTLSFGTRTRPRFSSGDIEVMKSVADLVAIAVSRVETERSLRDSEQRLARSQEIAHLGSWELDLVADQLTWSDEVYRIFGLQPQEFDATYEAFLEQVHPDDRAAVDAAYSGSIREGRDTYEIEHRVVRKDTGEVRIIHEKCEHFRDASGKVIRSVGMVHDVTEQKRAAEQIEMMARFPSENPSPVLRIASDGTILYSNGPGLALLEQWNRKVGEHVPPDWRRRVAQTLDSGRNVVREIKCGQRILSLVLAPVVKGAYVNLYGRDITKERKAELDLRRAHAELEKKVQQRTAELVQTVGLLREEAEHRMQAEEAVKAERQRLSDVLETLPAYVCLLTSDYHMPFANRVFREWFGYYPDKKCYEFLFNRTEPCEVCETYTVLKTNKSHRWEWTGPNGHNYDIFDFPFKDTDGSQLILEMGMDITEQKRAQEALRSSALYTRGLIEASLDPLVTISGEGKITDVNQATIEATGLSRQELIGTDFSGYFTEPHKAQAGYRQVFEKGTVTDYPLTIRHRDGRLTDVLYNAAIYKNEAGEVQGVFAAARDVTVQKQASQYARSLIEASLDPLVTISAAGKITDVNEATIAVTGVAREQLIGTDFSNYFTEPQRAQEGYQQVFAKGRVMDYPLTIRHRDGRLTDVLYNATIYKDTQGNVAGVFAAARDITEKRITEQELEKYRMHLEDLVKQRTEELARSNRDLEQFAYVASHDLQEPLRAVAGFVELLRQNLQHALDGKTTKYMDFAVDGVMRMQSLISGLLEYSRIGTRGRKPQRTDAGAALERAIANLQTSIKESGAEITSAGLPIVHADDVQLAQLFQNLIGNAIKFRTEQTPRIHVSAVRLEDSWRFAVEDNGIGIEPQYAERIFLIFQRLHSREKYPGTGIGLSICKKIVERHNGKIWVESQPGSGSTFYFTIPDEGGPVG